MPSNFRQFLSNQRLFLFWGGLLIWLLAMWVFNFDLLGAAAGFLLYFALVYKISQKYILLACAAFGAASLVSFFIVGLDSVVGNYSLIIAFFLLAISVLIIMRESLIKRPRWVIDFSGRQTAWLAVIILIFIAFFIVQPVLSQPGYSFSGDFSFPFSLENYWQNRINTWSVSHSASVFGDLGHLFYLSPGIGLALASGGGMALLLKILIVIPFIVSGLGMFFLARMIFRSIYPGLNKYIVPAALVAAVIYQFNPWVLDHQPHYFLLVGYSFLPLTLMFAVLAWEKQRFLWIFLAALFFAITTVTPHYMVYTAIVLLIVFLIYLVADIWRRRWALAGKRFVISIMLLLLAIIFSSFWLWPLVSVQLDTGEKLAPDYVLRVDDIVAANSNLSVEAVFQLSTPDLKNTDSQWLWRLAAFSLPALALTGFVLNYKRRWALTLLILLLAAWVIPLVFLFLPGVYSDLIYRLPFSWILHDPSRTLGLACLGYGLLIGLFILRLTDHWSKKMSVKDNYAK